MSLQVEKLEGNIAKLTIEASAEDFEKAVDKAYQKNKNKLSVPGFRKGKVPRKMIEKMYGNTVFYEEAANILIPSAYAKAIDECTEEVVSQPKIEVVQIEAGKPFIFTAEVALKPEVTLGAYKSVEIEKVDTTVTEEEIDEAVNRERESNARTISVEDRAVQDGDMVVLDFEGFMDGAAFEGGKGENYSLTIGSGTFIPGFEDSIIGHKTGETFDLVTQGMKQAAAFLQYGYPTQRDYYTPYLLTDLPKEAAIKTGTPQVTSAEDTSSSFIGFYPADDPEIAFSGMVEHGEYSKFMIRQLIEAYYNKNYVVPKPVITKTEENMAGLAD